jgi:UDP:flavonoid glycosyltransferase YjiC (YdhE family)
MTTIRNILFSFTGGKGHMNPLLPLARVVSSAGHQVSLTGRATAGVAEQTSFHHLHPDDTPSRLPSGGQVTLDSGAPRTSAENGAALFFDDRALAKVHRILDLSRVHGYDMIVCDELDFGAMLAAELLSIPVVTVAILAAEPTWLRALSHEPMQALRASAGLGPDVDLMRIAGDSMVIPFPESFRPVAAGNPPTFRVRAEPYETSGSHPAADWLAAGNERHRIYVTLGTAFNRDSTDLLPRIVDAISPLQARVLVTTGPGVSPADVVTHSSRVRVESYVPQDAVMRVCDVAVLHGGSGSLTGAALHGTPVVLVPLGADQFGNALKVEELGMGRALDAASVTRSGITSAVDDVLADPNYARAARDVQQEIAELPPMEWAWEHLRSLSPRAD